MKMGYVAVFLGLLLIVVVIGINEFSRPRSVVVRFTNGPTVISTQVVPLQ